MLYDPLHADLAIEEQRRNGFATPLDIDFHDAVRDAVRTSKADDLDRLLAHGPLKGSLCRNLRERLFIGKYGTTLLIDAVLTRHLPTVVKLVSLIPGMLSDTDEEGMTPLMVAVVRSRRQGMLAIVEHLLPLVDLETTDRYGNTVVHHAAQAGCDTVVQRWGQRLARWTNNNGRTPFMLAAMAGHTSCLRLLLPWSDVQQHDHHHRSALMLAVYHAHPEAFDFLRTLPSKVPDPPILEGFLNDLWIVHGRITHTFPESLPPVLPMILELQWVLQHRSMDLWACVDRLVVDESDALLGERFERLLDAFAPPNDREGWGAQRLPRWFAQQENQRLSDVVGQGFSMPTPRSRV